tara:strand:+ start:301 stop:696 length:396 start_codon:yes stop_codon:yes gene_type:complete
MEITITLTDKEAQTVLEAVQNYRGISLTATTNRCDAVAEKVNRQLIARDRKERARSAQQDVIVKVNELLGSYPNPDDLRNAIYAVITPDIGSRVLSDYNTTFEVNKVALQNVEFLARMYEAYAGVSLRVGS